MAAAVYILHVCTNVGGRGRVTWLQHPQCKHQGGALFINVKQEKVEMGGLAVVGSTQRAFFKVILGLELEWEMYCGIDWMF